MPVATQRYVQGVSLIMLNHTQMACIAKSLVVVQEPNLIPIIMELHIRDISTLLINALISNFRLIAKIYQLYLSRSPSDIVIYY